MLLAAALFEASEVNLTFQSIHDLLELGFADFRLLGNPNFSSCQLKERYHQRAKLAVAHVNPTAHVGNGVLATQVAHFNLLYELHGGRWNDARGIDIRGSRCSSAEMQQLVRNNHYLVRSLCSLPVEPRSKFRFVNFRDKRVVATGKMLKVFACVSVCVSECV